MSKKTSKNWALVSEVPLETKSVTRTKPVVFISHDSRDADLAEGFGNLLTDVSGGILKPFCSSDRKGTKGIEFGEEWFKAIMAKLNDSTDVVALLTQYSIDRPWILYEAGVAKGKLGTPVFGVAIGVPLEKASTGPFAQFQNCADDIDSLTKLSLQLIKRNPDASPREEAVKRHVIAFRESMTSLLKKRGATEHTEGSSKIDETKIAKLFEEVKIMFRTLPDAMEEKLNRSNRRSGLWVERRFHPMMIEELIFSPIMDEKMASPGLGLLILISIFRDDLPWFYELGLELYRALESRNEETIQASYYKIRSCMEMCMHGPMSEILVGHDARNSRILHYLPEVVDRMIDRYRLGIDSKPPLPIGNKPKLKRN